MKKSKIKLINKVLSKTNEEVYLEFEINNEIDFSFKTWQFVMLETEVEKNKKIKRAYSIATTNKRLQNNNTIWFYIKKASIDWLSNYLTNIVQVWQLIDMSWPFWHFYNDFSIENYILISVWSWVWPIIWIYNEIINENKNFNKLVNIFWEKKYENINKIINHTFKENNENIKNIIYLSREEDKIKDWYRNWHVQDWINEAINFIWNNEKIKVFICWKPEMVNSCINILISNWINEKNIIKEAY